MPKRILQIDGYGRIAMVAVESEPRKIMAGRVKRRDISPGNRNRFKAHNCRVIDGKSSGGMLQTTIRRKRLPGGRSPIFVATE